MFNWLRNQFRRPTQSPNVQMEDPPVVAVTRPSCNCLNAQYSGGRWPNLALHGEVQDERAPAWIQLLELIEQAAADGREEFAPGRDIDPHDWTQIVTLPASIAKLTRVRRLTLYGSSLVRIPPQIGEMAALENFTPYTSYRLHWLPFEITRCKRLIDSTVSTRALYGNYKYRPPFPNLPQSALDATPETCSLCNRPFGDSIPHQVWISLKVATDVLPLLVHACSKKCLSHLPGTPERYVSGPHRGGPNVAQPPVGLC
ncbi:hypothetical protein Pan181_35840 [Aeoliella mucimassa]|uniref:Leucine Rich repeats (2 copies) n=1 Tax=Aeoliella mucimassa TaxID=2527972 RepID=A0A518ARL7_9BACT|nr:hypothetical protein Pan181_35840 [Aeoliella mucimassa]